MKIIISGWSNEVERQQALKLIESEECISVEIKRLKTRTAKQNAALHKGFQQVEEACRKSGITKDILFSQIARETEFHVSAEDAKEVCRGICEALYGQRTTTCIPPGDVKKVWQIMERAFAKRLGVDIGDFPSIQSQYKNFHGE